MLKFCVPCDIKGKKKDTFVQALISVIRLGLDHGIEIEIDNESEWSLQTDIVFRQNLPSRQVPQYLKLLKYFIDESNRM
ncbi:hypothetical protein LCGC14_1909440 [marine sediment metagenome]|uniref:Uncharacterized protein n=1 Tax=marine sediment metagenome TaxID=412755 RepID=A0A0F9FUM2_9ZZZZ